MPNQLSLPAASPRAVLGAILEVLQATEQDMFTQDYFRQRGVAQPGQAVTFVRFLQLLTGAKRLKPEVLQARQRPEEFRKLVLERFRDACKDAGWWKEELRDFGDRKLGPAELDRLLHHFPPLERALTEGSRRNMRAFLKKLHEVLQRCDDRNWLAAEYQSFKQRASRAQQGRPRQGPAQAHSQPGNGNAGSSSAAAPEDTPCARGGSVCGERETQVEWRKPAHGPPCPEQIEARSFVVGASDHLRVLRVQAWFNPPLCSLTPAQLDLLAAQIHELALEGVGSLAPGVSDACAASAAPRPRLPI